MGSSALVIQGLRDKISAKAIACREGLALAEDLLQRNLVITSNSKQVINNIHCGSGGMHVNIIREIDSRKKDFQVASFIYESRSLNSDAQKIAKFSSRLDQGCHLWLAYPHDPICINSVTNFDQ